MKRYIVVALAFWVAGCAQMIPARANEISPGKYSLEASGNVFASVTDLLAKIDKKAVKLCGEGKYEYLELLCLKSYIPELTDMQGGCGKLKSPHLYRKTYYPYLYKSE